MCWCIVYLYWFFLLFLVDLCWLFGFCLIFEACRYVPFIILVFVVYFGLGWVKIPLIFTGFLSKACLTGWKLHQALIKLGNVQRIFFFLLFQYIFYIGTISLIQAFLQKVDIQKIFLRPLDYIRNFILSWWAEMTAITFPFNWLFHRFFLCLLMSFWFFDIVLLILAFHPAHFNLLMEVILAA